MNEGKLDGIVVLVVDDNADSLDVICRILKRHGARVLTANGGKAALSILSETTPDVLLSDIAMPDMDGYDLVESIRQKENTGQIDHYLPAAAVTAFSSDADRQKCLQTGFQCHIAKPVDSGALITAVAVLADSARQH